jgi:hypothetical protein
MSKIIDTTRDSNIASEGEEQNKGKRGTRAQDSTCIGSRRATDAAYIEGGPPCGSAVAGHRRPVSVSETRELEIWWPGRTVRYERAQRSELPEGEGRRREEGGGRGRGDGRGTGAGGCHGGSREKRRWRRRRWVGLVGVTVTSE